MHDAEAVGEVDGSSQGAYQLCRFPQGERTGGQSRFQAAAFHQLHHQVRLSSELALGKHLDHVGMAQTCRDAALRLKSPKTRRIKRQHRIQELNGHRPIQIELACFKYDSSRAAANHAYDSEARKLRQVAVDDLLDDPRRDFAESRRRWRRRWIDFVLSRCWRTRGD
jgi:hypothetical protein